MLRYEIEAEKIKDEALKEPINILVWGPGDKGKSGSREEKAYNKRCQLKAHLKEKFPNAEIFFSEELQHLALDGQDDWEVEALQAKISHAVLALDIGVGVKVEIYHFIPTYPWFRDKIYIFIPTEYNLEGGMVRNVFGKIEKKRIQRFTEEQYDKCEVVTKLAFNVARSVAIDYKLKK